MSTLKLTATLSKSLPATATGGWRAFVKAATPLQCKKSEEVSEDEKEAAKSVKKAADTVSDNVKKMSSKVHETVDVVKEKAGEVISFGAAKVATEVVKKKNEMKEEEEEKENNNKK